METFMVAVGVSPWVTEAGVLMGKLAFTGVDKEMQPTLLDEFTSFLNISAACFGILVVNVFPHLAPIHNLFDSLCQKLLGKTV